MRISRCMYKKMETRQRKRQREFKCLHIAIVVIMRIHVRNGLSNAVCDNITWQAWQQKSTKRLKQWRATLTTMTHKNFQKSNPAKDKDIKFNTVALWFTNTLVTDKSIFYLLLVPWNTKKREPSEQGFAYALIYHHGIIKESKTKYLGGKERRRSHTHHNVRHKDLFPSKVAVILIAHLADLHPGTKKTKQKNRRLKQSSYFTSPLPLLPIKYLSFSIPLLFLPLSHSSVLSPTTLSLTHTHTHTHTHTRTPPTIFLFLLWMQRRSGQPAQHREKAQWVLLGQSMWVDCSQTLHQH